MTTAKDSDKIPAGWEYVPVFSRRGYYRHDGYALNQCQWRKPAIWTVATDEKKRTADIRCCWTCYTDNGKGYRLEAATLTIVGDTMTVEKGPWEVKPRREESPILAGIRWVQQQENAAIRLGSK